MPEAARLGDKSTGHDDCAPTALVTGSPNVFINGKPAARVSDKFASHGCDEHPPHQDEVIQGSSTVFINGLPAARKGDKLKIAGTIAEGSPNVFIGG